MISIIGKIFSIIGSVFLLIVEIIKYKNDKK